MPGMPAKDDPVGALAIVKPRHKFQCAHRNVPQSADAAKENDRFRGAEADSSKNCRIAP
jgi:hypothetical protein